MRDALLLDTHVVLWLDDGSDRLRETTRTIIEECWQRGGSLFVSAVSAWEIAALVDTGRIRLDLPAISWIDRFADRPGVELIPLRHTAAARAYQLAPLEHRDPGDRLLIATAIELGVPFVTYDRRIVRFAGQHGQQHGFKVSG